jgi:hypothetical protein
MGADEDEGPAGIDQGQPHQPRQHHARARWPALAGVNVRFRAGFAYVDGQLRDGGQSRFAGSATAAAHFWDFAIYRASHDDYEDSYLPTRTPLGSAEDALDCAAGLYINIRE